MSRNAHINVFWFLCTIVGALAGLIVGIQPMDGLAEGALTLGLVIGVGVVVVATTEVWQALASAR